MKFSKYAMNPARSVGIRRHNCCLSTPAQTTISIAAKHNSFSACSCRQYSLVCCVLVCGSFISQSEAAAQAFPSMLFDARVCLHYLRSPLSDRLHNSSVMYYFGHFVAHHFIRWCTLSLFFINVKTKTMIN